MSRSLPLQRAPTSGLNATPSGSLCAAFALEQVCKGTEVSVGPCGPAILQSKMFSHQPAEPSLGAPGSAKIAESCSDWQLWDVEQTMEWTGW